MNLKLVLLVLVMALVATASAGYTEAERTCNAIGVGSGCSGCNAPSVDCEWYPNPYNESFSCDQRSEDPVVKRGRLPKTSEKRGRLPKTLVTDVDSIIIFLSYI